MVLGPLLLLSGCATTPRTITTEKIVLHPPQSIKDGPQHPMDETVPGVANFGLISKDLWRGGQPTPQGMQCLATLGVKTIIDLREEGNELTIIPRGIHYVRVPISPFNADQVNIQEVLRQIEISPKPVFIHCHQGRDRTGLAVAAYRLTQGMRPADACTELRNFRVNFWWDAPIERRIHDLDRTLSPPAKKQLASAP
jgi:tyrosine-protein phosphatase SIW14